MKYLYLHPGDAQDLCIFFFHIAYKYFIYIPFHLQEHKALAETELSSLVFPLSYLHNSGQGNQQSSGLK